MSKNRFIVARWIVAALILGDFSNAIYQVVKENRAKGAPPVIENYKPWSDEILESAATLPVQDGGRVKPLSTYAGFTMLQLHGERSMKIKDGSGEVLRIGPTAWLLDCLFRPELAMELPTFRVDNADALEAIGVEHQARRGRYSYSEIEVGREKLSQLYDNYSQIGSKQRNAVQTQVVDLEENVRRFESLFVYFHFARTQIQLVGFPGTDRDHTVSITALMANAPGLMESTRAAMLPDGSVSPGFRDLWAQIEQRANFSRYGLSLFPPTAPGETKWNTAGELIWGVMTGENRDPATAVSDIGHLESLGSSGSNQEVFLTELTKLHEYLAERTKDLDSVSHIEMEYRYYQADWFLKAMVFFLLGSLSAFAMWTLGRGRLGIAAYWLTVAMTAVGSVCCVIAIVIRCLIMERPPVGNLYDTIIFIAVAVSLFSLLVEWMTRRRFALGIGPILGTALILLARRYEVGDASDHMDPLVAVLDSNYWLTTHVITITLGYAAGLLCAFLSAIYVLIRGLGLEGAAAELRRPLNRAVYGMLCFTLLLSLVGTVLGGIWANDSWGRFWGWDPKENGALLIVIWTLAILHARLGGYLKEWGMHVASLFTAVVVTFSWWHVNFLGVGLHNYGFTSGKGAIWGFYIRIAVVMTFGIVAAVIERASQKEREA